MFKGYKRANGSLWPYCCLSFSPSLPWLLPEISNNLSRECNSGAVEHFLADSRKLLWVPHHTPNLWDFRCSIQTLSLSPLPFSSHFRVLGSLNLACKPPGEGKVIWLHVHCLPHSWHVWGAEEPWAGRPPPFCYASAPWDHTHFQQGWRRRWALRVLVMMFSKGPNISSA